MVLKLDFTDFTEKVRPIFPLSRSRDGLDITILSSRNWEKSRLLVLVLSICLFPFQLQLCLNQYANAAHWTHVTGCIGYDFGSCWTDSCATRNCNIKDSGKRLSGRSCDHRSKLIHIPQSIGFLLELLIPKVLGILIPRSLLISKFNFLSGMASATSKAELLTFFVYSGYHNPLQHF